MACQRCGSERTARVSAKCSDCCYVALGDGDHDGYVPGDMGIGSGDYVEFAWCLACGQMRGAWPLPPSEIERAGEDEADDAR